jgi:hypothetical protein
MVQNLEFCFPVEPRDFASALPKLDIMGANKTLRLFDSLVIVCADQWDRFVEMTIITHQISTVFGHGTLQE